MAPAHYSADVQFCHNPPKHVKAIDMDREVGPVLTKAVQDHPLWQQFKPQFPGWVIRYQTMVVDEAIDWHRKIINLAIWLPDPMGRAGHAICHLLKHQDARGRAFTDTEEDEATLWAGRMLQASIDAEFWLLVLADTKSEHPARPRESA